LDEGDLDIENTGSVEEDREPVKEQQENTGDAEDYEYSENSEN
jgi:hypothetical protein